MIKNTGACPAGPGRVSRGCGCTRRVAQTIVAGLQMKYGSAAAVGETCRCAGAGRVFAVIDSSAGHHAGRGHSGVKNVIYSVSGRDFTIALVGFAATAEGLGDGGQASFANSFNRFHGSSGDNCRHGGHVNRRCGRTVVRAFEVYSSVAACRETDCAGTVYRLVIFPGHIFAADDRAAGRRLRTGNSGRNGSGTCVGNFSPSCAGCGCVAATGILPAAAAVTLVCNRIVGIGITIGIGCGHAWR